MFISGIDSEIQQHFDEFDKFVWQYLVPGSYHVDSTAITIASVTKGICPMLLWLGDSGALNVRVATETAIRLGKFQVMVWLTRKFKVEIDCELAAEFGRGEFIAWQMLCKPVDTMKLARIAIQHGHVELCLQMLGPDRATPDVKDAITRDGNVELVQRIFRHGDLDNRDLLRLAEYGHLDALKSLYGKVPLTREVYFEALDFDKIDVVSWMSTL